MIVGKSLQNKYLFSNTRKCLNKKENYNKNISMSLQSYMDYMPEVKNNDTNARKDLAIRIYSLLLIVNNLRNKVKSHYALLAYL